MSFDFPQSARAPRTLDDFRPALGLAGDLLGKLLVRAARGFVADLADAFLEVCGRQDRIDLGVEPVQ